MSVARARVHAMFNLDEHGEKELDRRLNGLTAEVLTGAAEAAAVIHERCANRTVPGRCTRCQVRADILDVLTSVADVLGEKATAPATTATPELIVYRAGFHGHDIPLGLYTTATAARAHCEAQLSIEYPAHVTVVHDWIGEEDDPEEPWELVAGIDGGEEQPTGYVVTPLIVAHTYDPEADG